LIQCVFDAEAVRGAVEHLSSNGAGCHQHALTPHEPAGEGTRCKTL
jgi:hypothetical protein